MGDIRGRRRGQRVRSTGGRDRKNLPKLFSDVRLILFVVAAIVAILVFIGVDWTTSVLVGASLAGTLRAFLRE
jgi:small-conductance mechanosensitive channel